MRQLFRQRVEGENLVEERHSACFVFLISKLGTRPQGGESEGQYRTRNFEQQKFF